jgi:hypothetical protein
VLVFKYFGSCFKIIDWLAQNCGLSQSFIFQLLQVDSGLAILPSRYVKTDLRTLRWYSAATVSHLAAVLRIRISGCFCLRLVFDADLVPNLAKSLPDLSPEGGGVICTTEPPSSSVSPPVSAADWSAGGCSGGGRASRRPFLPLVSAKTNL